ncbi:DNA polymerase Y family protein [Humibacter sp. RRB41]|uniref:DNA polymerase Y family protein n=1 Tax=Humibacter sp. RRB41 TaxID=2919946 RepID=UPI001FAA9830|nr:DNA polymerase Y family protein [Humibacter sp. RRB41]
MSGGTETGVNAARSIVLWCPDWPVRTAVAAGLAEDGHPIALIDKGMVFASSAAARHEGVRRGLRVREAQARCAELTVLPYDATADQRHFDPLMTAIEQAVPGVQPVRPGLCALRARGPARFYGGEDAAAAELLRVAAEHGSPDACIGIADGPFAAEQAARAASRTGRVLIVEPGRSAEFLAPLPVDVLGDPAFATLLHRLSLDTLGAVAKLTTLELGDRFGELGVRTHVLANGSDRTTVVPREPQALLERSAEFEPGLDRVDELTFAFRRTADDFVAGLTAVKLVATAVRVSVEAESGAQSERTWLHPRWFTAVDVVDRVRWQLQGSGIDSGLDSPVVRVTVAPETVDAASHHEDGLFGGGPDERVHHALSRVQSMLGHDAVGTPAVSGGRLLADRAVLVPWGDRVPDAVTSDAAKPWPGALPPPLPATVYSPTVSCSVVSATGDQVDVDEAGMLTADPTGFSVRGRPTVRVTAWAGPWPVEERWWDEDAARSLSRLQLVDETGGAWLVLLERGAWALEARYD